MAPFIPQTFINDLLAQCNIVELIQLQGITLQKRGANYISRCPFPSHEENTPSFTVSETKQLYHCFGCGVGGNAINFVMTYQNLGFVEAVEYIANHLQISLPQSSQQYSGKANTLQNLYGALKDAIGFYEAQLKEHAIALEYLKKRGISKNSIQHFKLGFAPLSWSGVYQHLRYDKKHTTPAIYTSGLIIQKSSTQYYDRFRNRIIFPIRNKQGVYIGLGGRVLNTTDQPKYINSPETPVFHKSRELYGLYETYLPNQPVERIWIVEGYVDVIMLYQHQLSPVVATLGTSISRFHLQQLFYLTEEIIFCFDGDTAGKKAAIRALELSLANLKDNWTIRFVLLPEGDDPDSWIRHTSLAAREHLIGQALSLEDFLFQYIQKDIQLHTIEGQRKIIKKAIPLFKKIPKSMRQEQLFQRLSQLLSIEVNKLQNLSTLTDYKKPQETTPTIKRYTVLDRSIGLVLQYPHKLATSLFMTLHPRLEREYPLLLHLIRLIRDNQNMQTALLLEQFRKKPSLMQYLTELAQYNWLIPEEGVVAEFKDILIHLNKTSCNKQIKALLQKGRASGLTSEEESQLTQLLEERH